jgi:hypothetical protein
MQRSSGLLLRAATTRSGFIPRKEAPCNGAAVFSSEQPQQGVDSLHVKQYATEQPQQEVGSLHVKERQRVISLGIQGERNLITVLWELYANCRS